MGNIGSNQHNKETKSVVDDDSLQRFSGDIIGLLKAHREHVFGIAHSVETQHALVQLLYSKISRKVKVTEGDGSEDNDVTCPHCSPEWQEQTKRLLGSVQSSLQCQSKSLQSSFKSLNSYLIHIKNKLGTSTSGTSVDPEKFWIDYENSPKTDDRKAELDELKYMTLELEKEKAQIQQMGKSILTLKAEKKELEEKVTELEGNVESLVTVNNSLEQNLNFMKQTISVQLYHNLKGGVVPFLLAELKTLMVSQMNVERHQIQFILCQNEKDINPEIPVFVFCINASRLGTDAAKVLHDLKVTSKVSVVIFHHRDSHALPSQSSDRVLTGPEFKALGGIFDIAFLSEKGIYPCDMNNAAAAGIETFLQTQS